MTGFVLLDTHVLVQVARDQAVAPKLARLVERAADSEQLLVSAISAWEIAMLIRAKKLKISGISTAHFVERCLAQSRATVAPADLAVCLEAGLLEGLHGDPADRIIAATARIRGATLVTRDQKLLDYGATGGVKTLEP